MENAQVARVFDEIADLIELDQGNEFRVRAYRAAAHAIRSHPDRLEELVAEGRDLSRIRDIGSSSAEKIHEILETGTCDRLEEMRSRIPSSLTDLLRVPHLGPRMVMQLHEDLGIESLEDLRQACEDGRVRELEGFGKTTEKKILKKVKVLAASEQRMLVNEASDRAATIGSWLEDMDTVSRWEVAGSFRRRKETIGDLDIVVQASDRSEVAERIVEKDEVVEVLGRGEEKVAVRLDDGLQIDLRFVEEVEFGAALVYFTGSKAHNVRLRKLALERNWKLNEYGLFKGENRLAGSTEESIYNRLNLTWVPPELREDRGEVEAAAENVLPELIDHRHIRGDLQSHTDATDGRSSVLEMAQAAAERGYEYFAITDHSKRVTMANGLDDDAALELADAIREVDDEMDALWLLAGIEVDILKSGALDLRDNTLEQLDWVVAGIHYDMDMSEVDMTERLLAAIRSGLVNCLGHPTARSLQKREPIAFNADRVLEACAENDVFIEINAQPDRLDLPDHYCKHALDAGVRFTVSTDAHQPSDLGFMSYGVDVARRGWLGRRDVINTRTVGQFRKEIRRE